MDNGYFTDVSVTLSNTTDIKIFKLYEKFNVLYAYPCLSVLPVSELNFSISTVRGILKAILLLQNRVKKDLHNKLTKCNNI